MEYRKQLVDKIKNPKKTLHIALAGKYTHLTDSYMSVIEALQHAGIGFESNIKVHLLNMEDFEDSEREKKLIDFINEYDIK